MMRAALVVAEMALAVVLLTGAGLLIRSFLALTRVDPGFRPSGAMALRVTLQGAGDRGCSRHGCASRSSRTATGAAGCDGSGSRQRAAAGGRGR